MSSKQQQTDAAGHGAGFLPFLIFTALAGGTLIMVIEVMGSRVIGPFFGVSIFVWTSLITVTMIALAVGYACGGALSDKKSSPDYLYGIIGSAGVFTLLIPIMKSPVIALCVPMGLRTGAFVCCMILFWPPLMLLGCVSPYVIKIAASKLDSIGKTVGSFYALSTVGSVAGTVLSGFVLVAYLGVSQIFFLVGALLVGITAVYFAWFRRKFLVLLPLIIVPVLYPSDRPIVKIMPSGTKVEMIEKIEGYYGSVKVVDYSFGYRHTREMIIDGLVQGGIDVSTRQSIYPYSYILGVVPQAIRPRGKRCLVIGLGAGIIPPFYDRNGVITDVVDIDPNVVHLARKHFDFKSSGDIHIDDARYFLITTPQRYDYLILDVFNGDTTPGHLLSREAFAVMKEKMTANGVMAVNFVGSLKKDNYMTASIVRTLEELFDHVDLYPNFDPRSGDGVGNISLFAYNGPEYKVGAGWFSGVQVHSMAQAALFQMHTWKYDFPADVPYMILTDDYNPIDCYDTYLKENVRKDIISSTDWDILNG